MCRTGLSQRFGGAGLLALCLCSPIPAHAYQVPDLQGHWEFNSIASGPGAPWWERATATIAPNGAFSSLTNDNTGSSGSAQGTLALSPAGIVTLAGASVFRAALDQGTTVLVGTDTWSGFGAGTTELRVGLKMGPSYAPAEMAGAWEVNTIASGPGAPWWQRGRITVAANGGFSGTFTDSDGASDPVVGTFTLTPAGVLTFAGSPTGRGVLDVGRTVLVMTSTWTGFAAGTVDLSVGLKMAASYTLADLVGTWDVNGLATGPGAPWWTRSHITIAADGSFTSANTESNGTISNTSGTLSISPAGVITRVGSSTARGVLDADKTVMVWTNLWASGAPGTTQLEIATKTGGATLDAPGRWPTTLALAPVRPNPAARGPLTVSFVLANETPAWLELFDVNGRCVERRDVGALGAGPHELALGMTRKLPGGIYLMRMRQGELSRVQRVVVLN
ncbi:MAG: hypothetical protein ABL977_00015 [Candidatus Eisenbacteria bacterium]